LVVAAAVVAAGGVLAATGPGAARSVEGVCARTGARSAERAAMVSGSGPSIAVIGDSYAQGLGLDRPGESWPSRLPGRVHVDGFAGSGFSGQASPCRGEAFADRVAAAVADAPDLVVVEGGLNDYDVRSAAVAAGVDRLLDGLAGHRVLLVGPVSAPARSAQVPRIDGLLATAASRHDVRYLRMTRVSLSYLSDGLHLTAAGHQAFGELVGAVVAGMLASPTAP
jgi:acyl-CoA thioesterase-1